MAIRGITGDQVRAALTRRGGGPRFNPSTYRTRDGRRLVGGPVSSVADALRDAGWRGVGRVDEFDLKEAGVEVVEAAYDQAANFKGQWVLAAVGRWQVEG